MKQTFLIVAIALFFMTSCGNKGETSTPSESSKTNQADRGSLTNCFQQKRQVVYEHAANAVAKLIAHKQRDSIFAKNLEGYNQVLYGQMLVFYTSEDTVVHNAFWTFKNTAEDYMRGSVNDVVFTDRAMNFIGLIRQHYGE